MFYKIRFTKLLEKTNKKETDLMMVDSPLPLPPFIFMNNPLICSLFRDKVMALKIIKNVDKYREAAKLEVDLALFEQKIKSINVLNSKTSM